MNLKFNRRVCTVIGVLISGWSSALIASEVIPSVMCFDCTESEARALAIGKATPFIECSQNNDYFDFDQTQSCYSQPQKVIVFDGLHKTPYPYTLSHSNQGGPRNTLTLNVATWQLEDKTRLLLSDIADAHLAYQDRMSTFVADTLSLMANEGYNLSTLISTAGDNKCADDPGLAAYKRAASQGDTNGVSTYFQMQHNRIKREAFDGLPFDLSSMSFSYTTPSTQYGSVGLVGTFNIAADAHEMSVIYTNTNGTLSASAAEGVHIESSAVVYLIDRVDGHPNVVEVSVSDVYSRVDGIPLNEITGDYVNDANYARPVNQCVRAYLEDVYQVEQRIAGVNDPDAGGGGTYDAQCVYDYYTTGPSGNAQYIGTFKGTCEG